MTDFEKEVTDVRHVIVRSQLTDQGGNVLTELPVGATLDCVSSNPAVWTPLPMPGGTDFEGDTGNLGETTITVTPGGTLDPATAGPAFAPRDGHLVVVASEPKAFQLSADDVDELPPPPAPTP